MWNKIKWVVSVYVELQKKSYLLVRIGATLLYKIPLLIVGFNIVLKVQFVDSFIFDNFEIVSSKLSDFSIVLAVVMMLVGIILIMIGIFNSLKKARKTSRVLIVSMLGESAHFPDNILFESEKNDARETIQLGLLETNTYIEKSIEMFNSEQMVDIYHRFILHQDCKKVFLGGRARVPFLVAYGSCFRNISAKIIYYDQLHENGKWCLLNDEDTQIELEYDNIETIQPNNNGEIGVALGFTTSIGKHQLFEEIENNTLFISPNCGFERNLIKNQNNLEKISSKIKMIIDQLSSKQNCKTIHLFLSVQVSVALEIGRNYQEGTHKKWVIYNFDGAKYAWAIQLNSSGMIEKF